MIIHPVRSFFLMLIMGAVVCLPSLLQSDDGKEGEVKRLILELQDPKASVRWSAADALGSLGEHAKEALPQLIDAALKDSDVSVRWSAAYALGRVGEDAKKALPQLTAALKDPDASIRKSAVDALGNLGEHAKEALPQLAEVLKKDSDVSVRARGALALGNLGKHAKGAVPQLTEALKDSEASVRKSSADALGKLGEHAKEAVPQLAEALKDSDASVRKRVAYALGSLGEHAKEAVPQLAKALKDSEAPVRKNSADALGRVGEDAKEAVPQLAEALKDSNASVRKSSADALGRMGEHVKRALPQLAEALKDPDISVRQSAAYALGKLGKYAKEALPQLIDAALKDSEAAVRERAVFALGSLGEHAKEALPQLVDRALKDSDASVRETALSALESLREYHSEDIDRLLKEKGVPPTPKADLCKVLCGLVDQSNVWIREYYAKPEFNFQKETFGLSLLSLSALFLSRASPFCPKTKAKEVTQHMIAHLSTETSHPCPPDTFPFESLQTFATDVLAMSASPLDSPQVYGKKFLTLFLRDALRRGYVKDSQMNAVKTLLEKTENSLTKDLKVRPPSGLSGSLFTTYALSTVLLTLQQENMEEIGVLEQAIDPADPSRTKYRGDSPSFDSPRGSAARGTGVHLAKYIKVPQKDRDGARKDLLSAIQNYVYYLPSLMAHLRRGGTHMGVDELAPYYLYSTIPYQTAAIELLLEEKKPEEKKLLEQMREETRRAILSLVREDGQFYGPEYESSPGYVNPLFGLALIPLAKDCATTPLDQNDLHGILVRNIP